MKKSPSIATGSRRRSIAVLNGAAHRGAERNIPAFEAFNARSTGSELAVTYVDPAPGRAATLSALAREHGITAYAIEGRVEAVIRNAADDRGPVVLNLDRSAAVADFLKATRQTARPILAYMLVKFGSGQLWGIRLILAGGDDAARESAIRLFEAVAEVSARRGSGAILGEAATPADRASEGAYRASFAEHTTENLTHLCSGTEVTNYPVDVWDGERVLPLVVRESREWVDPASLARDFAAHPPFPLLRGERAIIAEIKRGEGIRFHEVAHSTMDGEFRTRGGLAIDDATLAALSEPERQRLREAALVIARQTTLSLTAPAMTTD